MKNSSENVRKLGTYENQRRIRNKSSTIAYQLTLSSSKFITEHHVEESLKRLQRHYQILRVCFREEDGVFYFREMSSPTIDFQIIEGQWQSHYHTLLSSEFDYNGPLWKAWFIPGNQKKADDQSYTCQLLLSFSHVITDGASNQEMCNTLMKILDSSLDDTVLQLCLGEGVKITPPIEDLLPPLGPDDVAGGTETVCKWSNTFPVLDNKLETKLVVGGSLSEQTTQLLLQGCKDNNATVNGAVMTAINDAIYTHFADKGKLKDGEILPIKAEIDLNTRRFLQNKNVIGLYKTSVGVKFDVNPPTIGEFWLNARRNTTMTQRAVHSDAVKSIHLACEDPDVIKKHSTHQEETSLCYYDYCISNLGNVSAKMFPGVYRYVSVLGFNHSSNCLDHGVPFTFNVETFRGKLCLNADALMRRISEVNMNVILKSASSILRRAARI